VIKGDIRVAESKKIEFKRPFFDFFTRLGSRGMMSMITKAHDDMDAYQKAMDRETGIQLLEKAEDVLDGLQNEIATWDMESSSEEEWDSDDDEEGLGEELYTPSGGGRRESSRRRSRTLSGSSTGSTKYRSGSFRGGRARTGSSIRRSRTNSNGDGFVVGGTGAAGGAAGTAGGGAHKLDARMRRMSHLPMPQANAFSTM
jgi:hypothetical protein